MMALAHHARQAAFLIFAVMLSATASKAVAEPLVLEVAQAEAVVNRSKTLIVRITLAEPSSKAFAAFTASNVDRAIELRVNGKAVMDPITIKEPVPNGIIDLVGWFETLEETRDLADRLAKGGKIEAVLAAR